MVLTPDGLTERLKSTPPGFFDEIRIEGHRKDLSESIIKFVIDQNPDTLVFLMFNDPRSNDNYSLKVEERRVREDFKELKGTRVMFAKHSQIIREFTIQ